MKDNYKKIAQKAAEMIKPYSIIGLGAGKTVAALVEALSNSTELTETLQLVSSSEVTSKLLKTAGLDLKEISSLAGIDIYFDGFDHLDSSFNALKSGGGIHTDEKAMAFISKEVVLLGDDSKYIAKIDKDCLFTVEALPDTLTFIQDHLQQNFDINSISIRLDSRGSNVLTKRGTVLLDVKFNQFPELSILNSIKTWPGIIDHSLFYNLITKAIIGNDKGTIELNQSQDI